ncbi:MAG: hypothetical protein P4L26_02085 [Terracidiphilus sp.]|nr:hypothetical protein [Terracidiphilus sp.]
MSKGQATAKFATPNTTCEEKAIASAYIAQARQQYMTSTSDLEIDDEPQVSIAEGGAWVAAWVWVTQGGAGLAK